MKDGWKKVRFSDFVIINPKISLEKGKEYPFIKMEDISPGNRYVSFTEKRWFKGGGSKFITGDVLFARITPCLENGKIVQVKDTAIEGFGSTEFFVFRHREGISDSSFIYYLSVSDIIRKPAEKSMFGASGRQRADLNVVQDLEIDAPPLPIQRKIAAILSAYDNLIENNTRRIQILEEMAQAIYKEWFVKFRFPGYEKVKMVDSELGPIPAGWEVKRLGDVVEIFKGKSYKSSEILEDGGLPFANLKCIVRGGGFRGEGLKRYSGKYNETQVVRDGDIVVAVTDMSQKREVVGRVARIPRIKEEKMIISLDLAKVLPVSDINKDYMYCLLRYSDFGDTVKQYANGVNVLHLNPEVIKDFIFVLPSSDLIIVFGEISNKIFQQIDILREKNTNLRYARDLLLPKLISGEIDVEDMDIKTEESEE